MNGGADVGGGGGGGTPLSAVPPPPHPGSSKTNALNISQKMIEMFVRTKHKIDKSHEFALVVVNNDATWVSGDGGAWGWDGDGAGWGWGWDGDGDGMRMEQDGVGVAL